MNVIGWDTSITESKNKQVETHWRVMRELQPGSLDQSRYVSSAYPQ